VKYQKAKIFGAIMKHLINTLDVVYSVPQAFDAVALPNPSLSSHGALCRFLLSALFLLIF
jgi:hypothetical protein